MDQLDLIKGAMLQASDYPGWDHSARVTHLVGLIRLCTTVQCFSIPDLRVGRNAIPWSVIFEWWMAPGHADQSPLPASVSRWYDFAARHFIFNLNWALGSILGSLLDRDGGEGEILERWSNAGLPWTVMWYKDMICWGVMDPIAASAMSKRWAVTRHDAMRFADEFWQPVGSKGDGDLIPTAVSDWFDDRIEWPTGDDNDLWAPAVNMGATIEDELSGAQGPLRVLPAVAESELVWLDPAGYALARSSIPDGWSTNVARNYYFLLDPHSQQVDARPYVGG